MAKIPRKVLSKADVLADLTQVAVDLAGIVDPTPVSDVVGTCLSLWRGDWFGAAISFAGVIPGAGDAAKIAKVNKWRKAVDNAIDLARADAAFRKQVMPILKGVQGVVARMPLHKLPAAMEAPLLAMRRKLSKVLDESMPVATGVARKTTKEVVERFSSTERARNAALEWLQKKGAKFDGTAVPTPGALTKKHTGKTRIEGLASESGGQWTIRLDYDPGKGPHYNATFRPTGASKAAVEKRAFTFPAPKGQDPETWMGKMLDRYGDVSKRPLPND